jgi:hypothetical protein
MFGRSRVRSVEEVWALTVTGIYLAVCFFAGTDLSRFAYLGFPFILPVFLGELQQVRPTFGLLALIFGFPARMHSP